MYKTIFDPSPPFCYATASAALAAGATATPQINISNDCDFEIHEIRAVLKKAKSLTGSTLMQMSLSSGELFSNVGVDLTSFATISIGAVGEVIAPNNGIPIKMGVPVRVPANSDISVQVTNNNAEALVDYQVQLWGIKRPMKTQS